jgi:FecR protein
MNVRTLLQGLRIGFAMACLCAFQGAHAGQALLLPEGTVTLIRGTSVFTVDAPIAVQPGDLLATDAHGGAQIEDGNGTIIALGAGTRIALDAAQHGDSLALLSGWIKIARIHAAPEPLSIDTAVLHAALRDGAVVLHASRDTTSLFIETGGMTLTLPDHADARTPLDGEHYAERQAAKPLDVRPRPAPAFIASMPMPFRDPLSDTAPANAKPGAPSQGRPATYADLADWLTAPLGIRRSFVARFRPLAQGEPFRSQVRQNLRDLPEWRRVLCPPPAMPRRRVAIPVQAQSTEVES